MGPPGKRVCEGGRRQTKASRATLGSPAVVGPAWRLAVECAASRRRRGPVALRPRLSPGVPLSRDGTQELRVGTKDVNTAIGARNYERYRTNSRSAPTPRVLTPYSWLGPPRSAGERDPGCRAPRPTPRARSSRPFGDPSARPPHGRRPGAPGR